MPQWPLLRLLGTDRRLCWVSVPRESCHAVLNAVPWIYSNNTQPLPPSFRLVYVLEKYPKIGTLPFSFLKLARHNACNYIIAMLKDLPR